MPNTDFIPDSAIDTTTQEKNLELSRLIQIFWDDHDIVAIKRIENPKPKPSGWEVTFKDNS